MSGHARSLACAVVGIVAMAIGATAQQPTPALTGGGRPDFSGRWTADADPAAGRGRGDLGSGWGSPLMITQDEARLVVEYAFFGRGDLQPPLKFVYALDGSETRNTVMMGRGAQTQVSRTAWDAGRLVITTRHTFTDPGSGKPVSADVRQVLFLTSPTSLVVETTRAGVLGGPETATRTTFKKT